MIALAGWPVEAAASAEIAPRLPQPLGKRCAFPTAPTGPTASVANLFNRPPNRGRATLLYGLIAFGQIKFNKIQGFRGLVALDGRAQAQTA